MISFFTTIFFILGIIIGSFLNVVIYRFHTRKVLGGRSACMSCQNKLHFYELIPLISFFVLRGRCRVCKTKISKMYPIVEFITGLIFLGLFLKFQDILFLNLPVFIFTYVYYAIVLSLLIVIAFYDLRHKIIPDALSIAFGLLSFLGLFFFNEYGFSIHIPTVLQFFSGFIIALPFALFWLVSKGTWMGLGDAKLAIGLGYLIGLARALSGMVIAFWSGAILGILLVLFSKKYGMKSEIPFAPFLIFGTVVAFFFELYIFPTIF